MAHRPATRTEGLIAAIRQRIATRALAPGDRLPSVRGFARSMGVSPSTVVEAYDRLAAEGTIRARRGAGFYVIGGSPAPMALAAMGAPRDPAVDPFWVSRQALDADPSVLKPGCGWLPADWMPIDALRRALRAAARGGDAVLSDYGGTLGSPALRRLLLARFAEEGLEAAPTQLMLTGSGTEAIDLVCRLLLRPGDTVLVDDPCYFNFQALLRAHPVRLVGVPFTPAGPDLAAFARVMAAEAPRLYVTNSALHNPTGATITPMAAHRILAATGRQTVIVEDDIFADFEPNPSPRLAVLDGLDRVIRIGSFSKTLSASARCGYVAARGDWIERLVDLQIATRFGGPGPLAADLVAGVLAGGFYRKHMDEVRRRLSRARARAAERLAALGIEPVLLPRGGFYLWCRLPDGLDSTAIARRCAADGVILPPGNVFSISRTAASFLRFNVAQMEDERIFSALRMAMDAEGKT